MIFIWVCDQLLNWEIIGIVLPKMKESSNFPFNQIEHEYKE
jgi:hypothetical protein